jgi:hypothetical protein
MDLLPNELIRWIWGFLDCVTVKKSCTVNRLWYKYFKDRYIKVMDHTSNIIRYPSPKKYNICLDRYCYWPTKRNLRHEYNWQYIRHSYRYIGQKLIFIIKILPFDCLCEMRNFERVSLLRTGRIGEFKVVASKPHGSLKKGSIVFIDKHLIISTEYDSYAIHAAAYNKLK